MQVFVIPLVFILSEKDNKPTPRPDPCRQPFQIGEPFGKEANKFKYFYDNQLQECFRYRSRGGDDGLNSFDTEDACRQECLLADTFHCGGNTPSTGACNASNPWGPKCPMGSFCKKGPFTSMCCSITTEDQFNREYKPICATGWSLVTEQGVFSEVAVKGKKCDHKFCPDDSDCKQGNFLAHCCQRGSGRHQKIEIQDIRKSTTIPPTQELIIKNPIVVNSDDRFFSNLQSEIIKKITTQVSEKIYRENN